MENKYRECPYKHCMLPHDNGKYFYQFVFLIFSLGLMIVNPKNLTFIAIVLFVVPIFIDLLYWENKRGWPVKVKRAFIGLNTLFILAGGLGQCGFFSDNGDTFSVINTSLILSGFKITKKSVAWALLLDLIVPIAMAFSAPNRNSAKVYIACRRAKEGEKR